MKRPLFCPICGAKVFVHVNNTQLPEVHRLPDHYPAPDAINDANLCAGVVVTVTLDWAECAQCKQRMAKHFSGFCISCYHLATKGTS